MNLSIGAKAAVACWNDDEALVEESSRKDAASRLLNPWLEKVRSLNTTYPKRRNDQHPSKVNSLIAVFFVCLFV